MEKSKLVGYCYSLLMVVLGITLCLTVLPRVKAALNHLPVDSAIRELFNPKKRDVEKLDLLIATTQQSIKLSDEPRYWTNLSWLLFFQAEKSSTPDFKRHSLEQARQSVEQSLVRSPANSLLWFQHAKLDFLLNSATNKTVKALNLSIMTGPYELGHLLPRLQFCLWFLSKFDAQDRFLLHSQILIAWQKAPKIFIKEIALKNNNMNKIRLLLRDKSPDDLAAMEAEIEKTH